MYVSSRLVSSNSPFDAIPVVNEIIGKINALGAEFEAGVQIGGDPSVIGITGMWENLAKYQEVMEKSMADPEIGQAMRLGNHLFTEAQDTLWKVYMPPGDPSPFSLVSSASLVLTAIGDAAAFAAEAATTIGGLIDKQIGLAGALTGDRSRIVWVGFADSLAEFEADNDKLEASSEYQELFKKSEGLVVPNSLHATIWRNVSA